MMPAIIPRDIAHSLFGTSTAPSTLYVRTTPEQIDAVSGVLATTANPENPEAVEVSRPSDALAARDATADRFTTLLLGLGAVALVVGGLGIANGMVIAVLERRSEIGLLRAPGATRRFISRRFFEEAVLLSGIGGLGGGLLGVGVVAAYATSRDLPVAIDPWVSFAGVGAAVLIGAVAGVYPAVRAARMSPTEALNHSTAWPKRRPPSRREASRADTQGPGTPPCRGPWPSGGDNLSPSATCWLTRQPSGGCPVIIPIDIAV